MNRKGLITLAAEIQRQMNLEPQDKEVSTVLPNSTTVIRTKKRDIRDLRGSIKPSTKKSVKMDAMRFE